MKLVERFGIVERYIGGDNKPPMLSYYKEVADQSRPHTSRVLKSETLAIIDDRRPHESLPVKEYRGKNRRQFTREVFEDFVSSLNRIFKTGGIEIQGQSDTLKAWISENKFEDSGKNYDLLTYAFECLLREAFRDPNQILVAFPYNSSNPGVHPNFKVEDGGLSKEESVSVSVQLISWKKIAYVDDDVLVYKGGDRIIKHGEKETLKPFYFAADSQYWYTIEPSIVEGNNKKVEVQYNPVIWYKHETGESLVNFLPGEIEKANGSFFIESFLRPAFEVGDEAIGRISDEQAIAVKYAHPIPAVYPTDCSAPRCSNGYVDGDRNSPCSVCRGTGELLMPGPYEVYKMPKSNMIDGEKNITDPIKFIHPGTEIGKQAFDNWQVLLSMMKRSVGLDLLEGSANESGRAKELRLEKMQDRMSRIAFGLFSGTIDNLLRQIEALLVPNVATRKAAKVFYPQRFNLDGANDLKDAAKTALPEDRFTKKMAYYQDQYRSDPKKVRMKELAMCYAPLLLLSDDERTDGLNKGIYSEEDFIKANTVEIALYKIDQTSGIPAKDEDVFAAVDKYLVDRGMIAQRSATSIQEDAAKSPVIKTTEGVQGIIAISQAVADGSMTERAAEKLLVEVFGFSQDVAASIIEAPVPDTPPITA